MNKRLLVLAVAGAFGASAAYANENVSIKGHVESYLTVIDDAGETDPALGNVTERKFNTEGELSLSSKVNDNVYVRTDLDLNSRYSGYFTGDANVLEIEQIYGGMRVNDMVSVRVGRFNNPMGYESQDAPMKTTFSRSLVSTALDSQTTLYQNNIEGVAADVDVGPAKVTVGVLNDIGGANKKNSILANIGAEPLPGLNLELGFLTQNKQQGLLAGTYGNLIDFNAAYGLDLGAVKTTFFVDFLTADETLDNAFSVGAKLKFADTIGGTLRYDNAKFNADLANQKVTAITAGVNWAAMDNVDVRGEWHNEKVENDFGTSSDDDSLVLSAVFTF
ncbi:MAG: porin [Chromatiales bacterium]|nr:porin [Chromatiales bacterium]